MRILHATEDLAEFVEADARYAKVVEYVQELHLAMAKGGRTFLAVMDIDGGLRLAVSPDIEKLNEYLDTVPELKPQVFEVNTKQ